jgi:hypothetical protein
MFRQKVPAVIAAGAAGTANPVGGAGGVAAGAAQVLSPLALRLTGALLALGVAVVHVADQGGISSFNSPDWLGWSFRLIEIGAVLTAIILLLPWSGRLGWAAGVLVGLGPFLGYLATRSVGLPGDPGDVGDCVLGPRRGRKRVHVWTLLAQIDSDRRAGMAWGDDGALYWLARRDELSEDGLGPTSFTWQCS